MVGIYKAYERSLVRIGVLFLMGPYCTLNTPSFLPSFLPSLSHAASSHTCTHLQASEVHCASHPGHSLKISSFSRKRICEYAAAGAQGINLPFQVIPPTTPLELHTVSGEKSPWRALNRSNIPDSIISRPQLPSIATKRPSFH